MLTTVKTMTRKKTAHQNFEKNFFKKYKEKLREKAVTLLKKENVNTPFTQKIQAKF